MHEPLDLPQITETQSRGGADTVARWMSCYIMFIAFDFVASHLVPTSVSRPLPGQPFSDAPLPNKVVKVGTALYELVAIDQTPNTGL